MSLWGSWFVIGHAAIEFTNYGGHHWGIDNYREFIYLSDFAGRCLHVPGCCPWSYFSTTLPIQKVRSKIQMLHMCIIG